MKKYVIYAPHKCGSTVLNTILTDTFNLPTRMQMGKEITANTDYDKVKLQFERVIAFDKPKSPIDFNKDNFIFIPRNPIGIAISMYYSFGYTHNCPRHLKSAKERERFHLRRENIQNLGLHEFVNRNTRIESNKIKRFWDFPTTNSKTILPYELMVSNFSKFLKELLQVLDMTSAYDKIYEKRKGSFCQIKDKSDLIVDGKLKAHKRTTDIYEWKKKLSNEEQNNLISESPFIQQYDDFLNKLL